MSNQKKKIAIVGMACRFPGEANSPEAYWDVLKNGKDVVTEVSSERWGVDFYKHPDRKEPGKSYTFSAGVLPQVDQFDAAFFGISPREAAQMDPQQRLLLELTWEALENGEQIPERLAGSKCAVYIGIASTDYAHRRMDDLSSLDPYSMTGNTASIASNRISYIFDLQGPSVSVDTACSSSLVALHQACQSIWSGEAPMAITGGVNMLLHPFGFVGFSKASMLSPRGRCRAFDASGDGYVRSEGSAILFLKPLDQAEADGDPIHAVIVNTGANCDGRTNGITLPSADGQASLLQSVYQAAEVKPDDLAYVEAHGTGTAVGDPLEASALAQVLARPRSRPLPIGSAKTNLGHLETASGMAGLFKVILSLQHRALPPSLHFETPNPAIDFKSDQLQVVTKLTPLKITDKPLTMGVNSFGFGGANAHAIVEEYIPSRTRVGVHNTTDTTGAKKTRTLSITELANLPADSPLILSANTDKALRAMAGQYRDLLQRSGFDYSDVAKAAFVKRQRLNQGVAVHADNVADVVERLHAFSQGETHTGLVKAGRLEGNGKLALVFSGNGSQWQGMGCELLRTEPLFKEAVEEVNQVIRRYDDSLDLIEEFKKPLELSRLQLTEIAQPLLFALQVGIIRVLENAGLQADAVIGHSVGEVAAAWAAGALNLEQAVKVIYYRSHAQSKTQGAGRMAAAAMSAEEMAGLLESLDLEAKVSVAGINSPNSVTLSGPLDSLEIIGEYFSDQNRFFRLLDLDYAFHSPAMDPVETDIRESLQQLGLYDTQRDYYSTVSGSILSGASLDADYWWKNIRQPVLFGPALEQMMTDGYRIFLEVGPHPLLRSYVAECSRAKDVQTVAIPTIKRKVESLNNLLNGLYSCVLAGSSLDTERAFGKTADVHIPLPHYPWQREKHWYTLTPEGYDLVNRHREHPLLGYRLKEFDALWENQLDTNVLPFLADHVVDGGAVMPAAAYIEMALAASAEWFRRKQGKDNGSRPDVIPDQWEVENLEIRAPIVLDHAKTIRFKLLPRDGSFIISSRDRLSDNPWTENVVGRLLGELNRNVPDQMSPGMLIKKASKTITRKGHYQLTTSVGLSYGPAFQGVESVWLDDKTALARLEIPEPVVSGYERYLLHPALLDSGFQMLVDVFSEQIEQGRQAALIPVQMGKLYYYHHMQALAYMKLEIVKQSPQSVVADFFLLDENGQVLAELSACRFRGVQLTRSSASLPATYAFFPWLKPHLEPGKNSPLPDASALISTCRDYLANVASALHRDKHFKEVLPLFDLIVSMFAWQAIRSLNPTGDEFTLKSLAEQAHIESGRFPLLSRLLAMLVEDDLAVYSESDGEGSWLLATESDMPSAENIWLSVMGDSPAYLPELMLLGRCGVHLADVLQQKVDVDSLLFADKSSIQAHWNGASPSNLSMNLALLHALQEIVSDWPANRRLRILEIGGKDTEVTQQFLPVLPKAQCDYLYTHWDETRLAAAEFELEQWHFVKYRQLDLSDTDLEQSYDSSADSADDFMLSSYDIIIASNTLYQSNDLLKAQQNLKRLLAPRGLLLIQERQSDRFMDMTFGLQSDWWTHTDQVDQPIPLLMSPAAWRSSLRNAGFDTVEPLIEDQATGDVGAFLLVASHNDHTLATTLTHQIRQMDQEPNVWMILKDQSDVANSLAHYLETELKKAGETLIMIESGAKYQRLGPTHFAISPDQIAQSRTGSKVEKKYGFEHIIETLEKSDIHCNRVIHLMGLEWHDTPLKKTSSRHMMVLQRSRCEMTIDLLQALESRAFNEPVHLHLVTSGGALFTDNDSPFAYQANPSQSPLWGLGRVVMNEHPDVNCKLIDLQGMFDPDVTGKLLYNELLSGNDELVQPGKTHVENEVILSENVRHVLRMDKISLEDAKRNFTSSAKVSPAETKPAPFKLGFHTPGPLKNLYWQELPEQFVKADEIEIIPHATGLNFRDVMYAMGLLSDEAVENGFAGPTLGMEMAGTVIRTGSAVTDFKQGDEVVGFAPACFSSRVITQTTAITHKPRDWSFEEAATIPTTFFTVYYALKHLAQIQPGEKILIHGAAGGVGIAAIQYARYCGAEIFATAGSDEKRDFVRLLGADHVMDSRSLAFADQIMEITRDEGIDIVLNSLAGEAISRNLSVLKPFGRFLELGKRDFYENSKIGLRPFRNNISYFGIDADQLLIERPELASRLFREMMSLFEDGSLRPMPYRCFTASRIEDAFRYMQQSRQIGKVVVTFEDTRSNDFLRAIEPIESDKRELVCDVNGSYLVTGGLSGFGLKTAAWLVQKGARSLVLISRSASVDATAKEIIQSLQQQGVRVYTRACDVSHVSAVNKLVAEIGRELPPLKGIVHAAMVLDDGLIRNMSSKQFDNVLKPKIAGAWNLHRSTRNLKLDFFALYSSATTFVGNPGQANYVAANGFMESLVNHRQSLGLPACYAAWGAIEDVGYLARNEETRDALQSRLGGAALKSDQALKMLEKIILSDKPGAAVIDLDWGVIQRVMPGAGAAKYDALRRSVKGSENDHFDDIQTLIANMNRSEIQELVVDLLLDEIEQILRLPREKLDVEQSIFDLGMDSLMGMELVLAIEERFSVKLPVMALTEGANIVRIAERITDQLAAPENEEDTSTEQPDSNPHQDDISIAAARHGHTEDVSQEAAEKLSRQLIQDAIKSSHD